jgi:hypothetical protein
VPATHPVSVVSGAWASGLRKWAPQETVGLFGKRGERGATAWQSHVARDSAHLAAMDRRHISKAFPVQGATEVQLCNRQQPSSLASWHMSTPGTCKLVPLNMERDDAQVSRDSASMCVDAA